METVFKKEPGKNRKYPRAQWHDYNAGIFFVTVCTHNRAHCFGKISDNEISHTKIGKYLCRCIEELGLHYPGISVDRYVVMPNHFHAIIIISPVGSRHAAASITPVSNASSAISIIQNIGCLRPPRHPQGYDNFQERNHFNSLLSRAIGGLKSATTKQAHLQGLNFRWQSNFHDHIIRNQRDYNLISEYIDTNIANWNKDKFFTQI